MSDKKNLLNEGQVRQFMKLARLEPLTTGFVEGLTTTTAKELEETHGRGTNDPGYGADNTSPGRRVKVAEAEAGPGELEDFAADDLADDSVEGDEEAAHDELEADAELGTADEGRTVSVDDFLAALESALEAAMGDEVEVDASEMEVEEVPVEDEMEVDDVEVEDDMLEEDKAYTSKKEKPGADKRKGAEKRGAEGTKLKQDEPGGRGHKKGDDAYVNEEQGADDREDEHLGAEDGKESGKKQSMKDRRKEMRGARRAAGESGDPVPHQESMSATDELVEAVTKRVAARILKSALAKK